ncbi:capsular biosynthesis protein [Coralliovum pocilloporae]|uniref:capsular biosynthesis protein n=1 Tax=Coralliovum pocilloporae TaxID=3066369 RepID=UPI003307798F
MDWHHKGAHFYRGSPSDFSDYLSRTFDDKGITHILYHGDRRPYHQEAIKWADIHDISCVVTELGYLRPDWMTIEHRACSTGSHFPNQANLVRSIAEKVPSPDFSRHYPDKTASLIVQEARFTAFNLLFWPVFPHYRSHRSQHPVSVYSGWLWAKFKTLLRKTDPTTTVGQLNKRKSPYFVFGLQLDGDFQLRDHSPFSDMSEAIGYVIRSFAANVPDNAVLVIKPHPHESRYRKLKRTIEALSRQFGVADRIQIVTVPSIKTLCTNAEGFISVNSSAGFEALEAGCPTLSIMPTLYDVDGLTFQGMVDQFWANKAPPDAELYRALKCALAGTIQVRGTLYDTEGRDQAARASADRLVADQINSPDALMKDPPRLAKAKKMGVTYQPGA